MTPTPEPLNQARCQLLSTYEVRKKTFCVKSQELEAFLFFLPLKVFLNII